MDDTQDYTIDFQVKMADHTGSENIISHGTSADHWVIQHVHGSGLRLRVVAGSSERIGGYAAEITDTDWHHIAVCKVTSGGPTVLWGVYVDGVQGAYASWASESDFTGNLVIGQHPTQTGDFFSGHLDEIRIQKSNYFGAAPNDTPNDTITEPTEAYGVDTARRIFMIT